MGEVLTRIHILPFSLFRRSYSMNPLQWKREHQIAFLCAVGLGCLIGMLVGLRQVSPSGHSTFGALWCEGRYSCVYLINTYWLLVIMWSAIGGIVGAGAVYIQQPL